MDVLVAVAKVLALVGLFFFVAGFLRRGRGAGREEPPDRTQQLYRAANELAVSFDQSAHPGHLEELPAFRKGVDLLNGGSVPVSELLSLYTGGNAVLACMAMQALAERGEEAGEEAAREVLRHISTVAYWTRYFALRAVDACAPAPAPVTGALLLRIDESWMPRITLQFLRDFVGARRTAGEQPTFGSGLEGIEEPRLQVLAQALGEILEPGDPLLGELQQWMSGRIDVDLLSGVGRLRLPYSAPSDTDIVEHPALATETARLWARLLEDPPRSLVLVGEHGVGKTTCLETLADGLAADGWIIFTAGYSEIMAGQSFIGQLEERLRNVLNQLRRGRKVLWIVPEFHALQWAGRHQHSPVSVLDQLLPVVERNEVLILGETTPAAYERLLLEKPRVDRVFQAVRLEPLSEAGTLALAEAWAARHAVRDGVPLLDAATRAEAWNLSRQYLGDTAAPGNLMRLLRGTQHRLLAGERAAGRAVTTDDLIETLAELTGLPRSILDERENLSLDDLRAFFEGRVLGQPEAVECLVERIALIKAGLTDPGRPLGVFLFAGPTGTGKTEIGKAMAEFLFGSPERTLRLDMSEFQTPESLDRLMGAADREPGEALVDRIRKQPFSILLLDEFEKSHPKIWDLFLQVFDDGRLTDRRGNTADFRHAIIIMTSNLGSLMARGASLGFAADGSGFTPGTVERAIAQAFRPEFLNRIDRTVVFRPLSRDTMRSILHKELDDVTRRRGLRSRAWALEWEDDAIEFLLEVGFTPELGARPLRRAVEQHFLAPLAETIVNHRFPEGEQFLFVRRRGNGLEVRFVDPEVPDRPEAAPTAAAAEAEPSLARLVLDPRGVPEELTALRAGLARLDRHVGGESWDRRKQAGLDMTRMNEFWDSPERFTILGEVEYIDRIEQAVKQARSAMGRIATEFGRGDTPVPRDRISKLADRIILLEQACRGLEDNLPRDAFLLVEAGRGGREEREATDSFARRLGAMYRAWADRRGMRSEVLEERSGDGVPYRLVMTVAGFGAYAILLGETGLHVFEKPSEGGGAFARVQARVQVAPQPDGPARQRKEQQAQAAAAFDREGADAPNVVRRYRDLPSPLVRDAVRGWRTGRADLVFGGNFDLIEPEEASD